MRIRQRLLGYLARKSQEKKEGDKGFTLIELAIVIAVIAILIAVALPTFLGVQSSAHNSAAEQNIVNSITSAKTYYASNQSSYTGLTAAGLTGLEPSIPYVVTVTAGVANSVAVAAIPTDGQTLGLAAYTGGSNNTCILAINVAGASSAAITTGLSGHTIASAGTWWSTATAGSGGACTAVTVGGTASWSTNTP